MVRYTFNIPALRRPGHVIIVCYYKPDKKVSFKRKIKTASEDFSSTDAKREFQTDGAE